MSYPPDAVGIAPYTEPLTTADFAALNRAADQQGGNFCTSRPGASGRRAAKAPAKYTRCPGCGGKVIAPCILCFPEAAYDARLESN